MIGLGAVVPGQGVSADDLDQRYDLDPGTVLLASGVNCRFYCSDTDDQITMAVDAARMAIADAGLSPAQIDVVISAAAVPYQPIPATSPLIQRGLGIADGAAQSFDINSTCLSFLTALDCAAGMLAQDKASYALIVSSEVGSRALPWPEKPEIAGLFGDGAAAAVVSMSRRGQITARSFQTFPSAYESCGIGAGGTRVDFQNDPETFGQNSLFEMDGKALFRLSSRHFKGFVDGLLKKANWHRDDVDLVVPHQASPAGLTHMIRQCGFGREKVVDICSTHGNQIAASIPTALYHAQQTSRLERGAKVLILGTSAGVSLGGMALVI